MAVVTTRRSLREQLITLGPGTYEHEGRYFEVVQGPKGQLDAFQIDPDPSFRVRPEVAANKPKTGFLRRFATTLPLIAGPLVAVGGVALAVLGADPIQMGAGALTALTGASLTAQGVVTRQLLRQS